jgi:hypothetical protein
MRASYAIRIHQDIRLHRENQIPIVGEEAVCNYLDDKSWVVNWTPIADEVSAARDLGYTYGSYRVKSSRESPDTIEKGYYVHVWQIDEVGAWKLIADITNPEGE